MSVFIYEASKNSARLPLAKNAFKKLKTLRYPDVIRFIDGVEVTLFHLDRL